jgi:peptide deformylase
MFNLTRRYLRVGTQSIYNPVIERASKSRSKVTESQALLWGTDSLKGDRKVIRNNNIIVKGADMDCQEVRFAFVDENAWCVQSCVDLLDGRTIYDALPPARPASPTGA